MSTASEVLAAQLRSPGFRTAEPGYEPDQVRDHLALTLEIVDGLERRLAEVVSRTRTAEEAAARAEAQSTTPAPDDDELLTVVFEGQRQADRLVADAEERATTLQRQADERIAELRDDSEVRRLAAAADDTRRRLLEAQAALEQVDDDLRAAAEATRQCRAAIRERLGAALADLSDMALVMERT